MPSVATFTVAHLLRDCFPRDERLGGLQVASTHRIRTTNERYARREREASLQQYVGTHIGSATVPANAALTLLSTDALGAMHASGGVPPACVYSIGSVIRRN